MRTKTLLIAATALAAGIISSEAQTVYSVNVVGYANVITPAGQLALISNPLDLDGINNITNVLKNTPNGTQVQIWNGAGYTPVTRSSFGVGAWSANATNAFLPPGTGFFIKTPSAFTNTFIGNVVPAISTSNNLALPAGTLVLAGTVLPVSGTLTNSADQGPDTLNLGVLPPGTQLQLWNGNGFTPVTRSSFGATLWNGNPTISLGQGLFIKTPVATNWSQSFQ